MHRRIDWAEQSMWDRRANAAAAAQMAAEMQGACRFSMPAYEQAVGREELK
jgi:hypothetical protein